LSTDAANYATLPSVKPVTYDEGRMSAMRNDDDDFT
jgi:hypothetical protein